MTYAMPRSRPANLAPWRPDPSRAAVLIHDMQRYFIDFLPAGQSPTTELTANIVAIRETARRAGVPVLYSAQPRPVSRLTPRRSPRPLG